MSTTITRHFLGLDRPALSAAADWVIEQYRDGPAVDLGQVIVVVSGRRAGRRLLEILVDRAEQQSLVFTPPEIETVGRLPERLYRPRWSFAGELVQRLAWTAALKRTDGETLAPLIAEPPADDDLHRWQQLGELVRRQHAELARDGLSFADVVQCGMDMDGCREQQRWQALATVQRCYFDLLDQQELWDVQTARLRAIEKRECHTDKHIVLVGTADMNRALRRMLDQVADHVTALVFAPEQWADRFDEHGCLVPEAWAEVEIPLHENQVQLVDSPADQAVAVRQCLARYRGRYGIDEITIGVPDERLVPYLEQQLEQCGLPGRWGPGRSLHETGPYRLLQAVASYLAGDRFTDFAALVRHPDVHDWIESQGCTEDWLIGLDDYYNEHLPYLTTADNLPPRLATLWRTVQAWLGPLRESPRALAQWAAPLRGILEQVYGDREFERDNPADRSTLTACMQLDNALQEHLLIPAPLSPRVTAAEAAGLTLEQTRDQPVAARADTPAIELLGWLELPLDDAPALVVTSFNEGMVPQSVNSDLFLPNALRRRLGLADNTRRYARDAYALSVLLAVREQVGIVVGRRNTDGDPLAPSRLLFAADAETVARRARTFFDPQHGARTSSSAGGGGAALRAQSAFVVPAPRPPARPLTELPVTAFRAYLACPYRFYLRYVLGLAALNDAAEELDGAGFGNVLHHVLHQFGAGPASTSDDPRQIRRTLHELLEACVRERFGAHARPSVAVQIEQMRLRLNAFAEKQAQGVADGWRIVHTEVPRGQRAPATLTVDGQPFGLRGRIDRIDQHGPSGRWRILDYKSSDAGDPPEQTHQTTSGWVDLQLPLYRHLARTLDVDGDVELGYIVLPKDTGKVDLLIADWDAAALTTADAVAADVIRAIRNGEFDTLTEPPPAFAEEFAAICQDKVFDRRFGAVKETQQ